MSIEFKPFTLLGTEPESSQDLTRWNRGGLRQTEYINGNAATFLEDLRLKLRNNFPGNEDILEWLGEEVSDKNLRAWQFRLQQQYDSPRRDYGWEILRSLARSSHVLSRYIDAYSQEKSIRTATQWENLRRLVQMIGYRPAPAASAETFVALITKSKDLAEGTIEAGLQIKNKPLDGGSAVVFETLNNIEVSYLLNQIRAVDYDQSIKQRSIPPYNSSFDFPLNATLTDKQLDAIAVGDTAIVTASSATTTGKKLIAVAVEVTKVGSDELSLKVIEHEFDGADVLEKDLQIQLNPAWISSARLNGTANFGTTITVDQENNTVSIGDTLAYYASGSWQATEVLAIEGRRVELSETILSPVGFYPTLQVRVQNLGSGSSKQRYVLPKSRKTTTVWDQDQNPLSVQTQVVEAPDDTSLGDLYEYVLQRNADKVFYVPSHAKKVFTATTVKPFSLEFDGKPDAITTGNYCILQTSDGEFTARPMLKITEVESGFQLTVADLPDSKTWTKARAAFAEAFYYLGYNQNTAHACHNFAATNCQLALLLDEYPEFFQNGRKLWVAGPDDKALVTIVDIVSENPADGSVTVSIKPSLETLDLPKYQTWIYGNVVKAGHGEMGAINVLGDGNRILQNQQFVFAQKNVAFVLDSEFSHGVRADITIIVDGHRWTQVDNLRNSASTDSHYETELNETGELVITFGDGINGQRLPNGNNNVLIQARVGAGEAGNLNAGGLQKIVVPHYLLDSVVQPANATGGANAEAAESIRDNAPASTLTLDRAVSVEDYGVLAQKHSSVMQASSYTLADIPGATDRIQVVLVPSGGDSSSELEQQIKQYLEQKSRPGVVVRTSIYRAILLELDILLRIDTDSFNADDLVFRTKSCLAEKFTLANAKLGAPFYRSTLFALLEEIEGVENVSLEFNASGFMDENLNPVQPKSIYRATDSSLRRITPAADQLIYLNSDLLAPIIRWEKANG